ncbi:MAG: helix-turn-helix domain-containing protein [Flavobacteriales bacterium]
MRLKEFRKGLGLNQAEFAKSIGLKQVSYSGIERGRINMSFSVLREIVKTYKIKPLWLLTGYGEQFISEEKSKPILKTNFDIHKELEILQLQVKDLRQHLADKERIIQFMETKLK